MTSTPRTRAAALASCILVVACGPGPTTGSEASAALIARAVLEAELVTLRREAPTAAVAFDPRLASPGEMSRTSVAGPTLDVVAELGIPILESGDPARCPRLAQTQICGLDRFDRVLALGPLAMEGDSAVLEAYLFERVDDPSFPLGMAVTRYTLRHREGAWRIIEEEVEVNIS